MAATLGEVIKTNFGSRRAHVVTITGDTSYPTGGYSIPPSQVGMHRVENVIAAPTRAAAGTSIRDVTYTSTTTTGNLQFFLENFNEVGNGTDISTYSGVFTFIGI